MTRRLWGAFQFLTIIPIAGRTASPGKSAVFFPVVGCFLGLLAALVFHCAAPLFGQSIAGLLALISLVGFTGCFHEDALADSADAFRKGRSREKILAILLDSRIGAYGGTALVLSLSLRWQALSQIRISPFYGLPSALALSRAATVVLAHFTPPLGGEQAEEFVRGCSRPITILAASQAAALTLFTGWPLASAMLAASILTIILARSYFMRRLGGVNGDCLGATCQVVEIVNLLILASPLAA